MIRLHADDKVDNNKHTDDDKNDDFEDEDINKDNYTENGANGPWAYSNCSVYAHTRPPIL